MSRGVFLLGTAIAVVAPAFAVTDWVIGSTPGVAEANARRVKPGMTLREAEVILGPTGRRVGCGGIRTPCYRWRGPYIVVEISFLGEFPFDKPAVVRAVYYHAIAGQNPLARLRSWLGL